MKHLWQDRAAYILLLDSQNRDLLVQLILLCDYSCEITSLSTLSKQHCVPSSGHSRFSEHWRQQKARQDLQTKISCSVVAQASQQRSLSRELRLTRQGLSRFKDIPNKYIQRQQWHQSGSEANLRLVQLLPFPFYGRPIDCSLFICGGYIGLSVPLIQIIEIPLRMKSEPFRINTSTLNESSKCKSLLGGPKDQVIQLSQAEVNFLNTEINELYEISFQIRNVTQNSLKIKLKRPASPFLAVHLSKEGPLAAGLDLKVTVVYESKENQPISDKIAILTDFSEVEVPINVFPQVAKLQFEPFLNMGFAKTGSTIEASWAITNQGENSVNVKLIPLLADNAAKLNISSESFTLQPKETKSIKLTLQSSASGTVEGSIELLPKTVGYSTFQFVANFCEYSRMISDEMGNLIEKIAIEPLFGGQSSQVSMFLVNNTPEKCEFRVARKKGVNGEESLSLATPEQLGRDDSQKLVQFSPSQGELEPYSSFLLKAAILAKYEQSDLQLFCNYILGKHAQVNFEKEWNYSLRAYLNHEDQHLDLQLKGVSIVPKIGVSPTYLNFNECALQRRSKKTLKIENFSTKQTAIEFQNSANYSFSPKRIKIAPNTSTNVEVTFHPKKVGELNEICCLTLGVFSFPIKFFGKCIFKDPKCEQGDSEGEELPIEYLQKSCIEEEVSAIQKGKQSSFASADNSKNTIHFDTYRQGHALLAHSPSDKSFASNDNYKKTRILKGKNGKEVKLDLNHLNANQLVDVYPSVPKSQQEERFIARELTSHQLRSISVGPVVIDLGNIFLRSVQKKAFHICNFNPKPISIRLETVHESFSQTSDERQILPAESHGGFNLVFEALTEGPFKHTLQYVLNGNHFFELMVTGTCILPTLNMSRNQIKFLITDEDKKFQKRESITLENVYEYDIEYEWKAPGNSLFQIEPMGGVIRANSQQTVAFSFNYEGLGEGARIEECFKMKLKYGKTLEVRCAAVVPECNCVCKTQELRFGEISIGKQYEQKLHLKNFSKIATIFKVNVPKEYENVIVPFPKAGSIAAEEVSEIVFRVISGKPCSIDTSAVIVVRGAKSIEVPIRATPILPCLRIENEEIDFGATPIEGNPASKNVTLINDSAISVDLELRLHNDTFLAKYLKLCPISDPNLAITESKELKSYKVISLRINAKSRAVFTLEFTPQTAEEYEFYLPLFLPNAESLEELQKVCRCKGIKNKLVATEKEVNFGKIVIEQIEQVYSKSQTLEIRNPQEEPINWWVEDAGLLPFKLDKTQGKLEGFEKCLIKIFFSAETPGEYKKSLEFFIDQTEIDISRCYMKVPVCAEACFPTLYFDQPYLILPTAKLGEESRGVLQIINGGYENINLKHTVSQQYSAIDLKVRYVSGSNLGVTKKQIKVEVSFISDRPVSFTLKLNFHDANNRTFTINVSGTADSSTYTLLEGEKNPLAIEKSCNFLKHFLNNTVHLSQQLYEFPRSLIDCDFDKFSAFLTSYSQSFEKVRTGVKKNCKTFFGFQYVSEVIKLLKSEGAFLNHIRPEMLLNYEEYYENIKIRADNNATVLSYFRKKDKVAYQTEQKYSWLILFYQIFKVFSRVNPGKLKQGSEFWVKFATREKILLTWLEKTYEGQLGTEFVSKGNEVLSSLNNGEVLSSLISKYTNIKVLECYGKPPKGQKEKERRCRTVIDTFSQIGINCLLRLEDLLRCSEKEMLLIVQNLYLILPSYLQKGEPIVFNCQFGQVVTKSVQITNPSKFPITYVAKIEGCKAYSIEGESEFVIQSKKTQQVKIKYVSNVNLNNSPATLTLTGKTNSKFTPSTFIFVLKANNLGRISEKNVQVTGNLYEQLDFTVKVSNNFNSDGEFRVELQPSPKNTYIGFYLLNNTVKIRKGETVAISLAFIPFTLEQQLATLVFRDEKVGEFQYDLTGLVEGSNISQESLRIPQVLFTNKKYQIEVQIPTRNDLILRARKAAEYLADKLEKRLATVKDQKDLKPVAVNYEKYYPRMSSCETYTAKLATPNASILLKSEQISIKDIQLGEDPAKREDQKLLFEINLKSPIKEGSFTVNLKNASGTDLRKYKITLNAVSRPLRYQLQLKIPVNKALTQQLPLVNVTSDKNTYLVSLICPSELAKSAFSIDCEKEIAVSAKEQVLVALSFKPKLQCTYNALLKMENATTGQNIEYELVGIGDEPEAEVLQFQQEVRKEKAYSIKLPLFKNARCNVVSFTLDNVQYQKSFIVTNENPSFRFKVTPKVSGKCEGKLIIESDQSLIAYKVVVNVKSLIEGEIKLRTVERKEVWGEVVLPRGSYTIRNEDRNLKCPAQATITQETGVIALAYYSSKPEEKEIAVTFFNDQLGEISYIVKVIVEAMPEIKLEAFQIELGKTHKEKIQFQNTDDTVMSVSSRSSHPTIFFPEKENFQVLPRSKVSISLLYRASSLEMEEGKIYFMSDKNAKWTYHLSGYGLPQLKPEVKEMTVFVGEQICESLTFRNPLNKTLPFNITLENGEADSPFSTFLKSSKADLAYNQEIEIPITLKPKTVALSKAILKIALNEKVHWRYELIAKTYYRSNEEPRFFKLQAREKNEQTVEFALPFSKEYSGKSLRLNVRGVNELNDGLAKTVVKVLNNGECTVGAEKAAFQLAVVSYKPMSLQTQLEILAENGCKWIYRCDFCFQQPPIDDRFEIIAAINKPTSVMFKLTNRVKAHARFTAYFTSESCIDFTVNPKVGELEPYGREGTPIEVVFCPTQYKKGWVGKLVIQTEDSYWSYEVRGCLPHYNPPVGKSNLKQ